MTETGRPHGIASLAWAVAELLAECTTEVGRRVEPNGFSNLNDAAGFLGIAQCGMGRKKPASLYVSG